MESLNKSRYIIELLKLNKNCKFNTDIINNYNYFFTCSNDLEFNRFRKENYCIKIINQDLLKWRLLVQIAEENKRIYNLYLEQMNEIKIEFLKSLDKTNLELYYKKVDVFEQHILNKPIIEPSITIHVEYVSTKTQKLLTKKHEINYYKIKEIMPYMIWKSNGEHIPANNYELKLKNYIISKNFIKNGIKQIEKLNPFDFELWTADFMEHCGYKSFVTNKSGDYGADVISEKKSYRIAIQCKMSKSILGIRCVQEIIAAMKYYEANEGWVISTAPEFTPQAYNLANSTNIKLFNKNNLEILLNSLLTQYKD